jgi:hypothetical protein
MTASNAMGSMTFEHPVRRMLRMQILPYLESADGLPKLWFCRVQWLFERVTDFTVALQAVGIAAPLWLVLVRPLEKQSSPSIVDLLPREPKWLFYLAASLVIFWIFLRVTHTRQGWQAKAVLANSCCQSMKQAKAELYEVLATPDPMRDLEKLWHEKIYPVADWNIQKGSWPWAGPNPKIDRWVEAQLESFCSRFESMWVRVDPTGMR